MKVDKAQISKRAHSELEGVQRVHKEEREVVSQFFKMLGSRDWRHASQKDGTDVFRLPGERIHRVMGVTRTKASPDDVLNFFSDPKNFDKHFKILDEMFKGGKVVKVGGEGSSDGFSMRGRRAFSNRFAAMNLGGEVNDDAVRSADGVRAGALKFFDRLRAWRPGQPFDLTGDNCSTSSSSASAITRLRAQNYNNGFMDRQGHALLHGMFKLPSVIPDRDFVWDQAAVRLPTGSILIVGRSVPDDVMEQSGLHIPSPKGHVRGAVLTSGYYVVPEQDGGSTLHFVVQADPKGKLPAWIVNLVAPKQAHNVTRLRDYLDAA